MIKKKKSDINTNQLLDVIVEGIKEKKGKEITIIDLTTLHNAICDYFVICEGDSNIQVNAIADSVEEEVHKVFKEWPHHKEGTENAHWVLVDYFNIVVHIFQKEHRHFYKLEDLWSDGKVSYVKEEQGDALSSSKGTRNKEQSDALSKVEVLPKGVKKKEQRKKTEK